MSFESERTKLDLNDEVYDYVLEEIRSKARKKVKIVTIYLIDNKNELTANYKNVSLDELVIELINST